MESQTDHESRLMALPDEIKLNIVKYSSIRDLKSLRSSCKELAQIVTPALFSTLVVYPYYNSFIHLLEVSKSDEIRSHVQSLVLDVRWFRLTEAILDCIEGNGYPLAEGLKQEIVNLVTAEQDNEISRGSHRGAEMYYLSEAFRNLPRLTDISVVRRIDDQSFEEFEADLDNIPGCYRDLYEKSIGRIRTTEAEVAKQFRMSRSFWDTYNVNSIIPAAASLPCKPKSLTFESLNFADIMPGKTPGVMRLYQPALSGLKSLTISSGPCPYFDHEDIDALAGLPIMLQYCNELEHLDLTFERPGRDTKVCHDSDRSHQKSIFNIMHPNTEENTYFYPFSEGLKTLKLTGVHCRDSELRDFLTANSKSLQTLELTNLKLLPDNLKRVAKVDAYSHSDEEEHVGPKACLVEMLRFLRGLQIANIRLRGVFRNGGGQYWILNEPTNTADSTEDKLLFQLDQWLRTPPSTESSHFNDLVDRESCPLTFASMSALPQYTSGDLTPYLAKVTKYMDKSKRFGGDDSFAFHAEDPDPIRNRWAADEDYASDYESNAGRRRRLRMLKRRFRRMISWATSHLRS